MPEQVSVRDVIPRYANPRRASGSTSRAPRSQTVEGSLDLNAGSIPQNRQNPNNRKAPRAVLSLNRGFVELEAFTRNKLRRTPTIELYPWNAPPATKNGQPKPAKLDRDPLRLARYYQSLLDSGKFESRVALARFLGVSRARVTQVLNRLKSAADSMNPRSDHKEADVA